MKTIWLKLTCEIVSLAAFIFYYKVIAMKEKMKEKAIQTKKKYFVLLQFKSNWPLPNNNWKRHVENKMSNE